MFNGSERECRKALQPLIDLLPDEKKYRDIWRQGSYSELNDYLLSYPTELPANVPASVRALGSSRIIGRKLTVAEWRQIVEFYKATPSSNNVIDLEPYGGAINAPAPDATAFCHRRASLDAVLWSFWLYEHRHKDAEEYLRKFDQVVTPLSNGESYQNYPNRDNRDFGRMYFGGNLERLVEIKRKYDPDDLFAFQQGLLKASLAG
jgi:FAD/FMN-containing dehydrogenase